MKEIIKKCDICNTKINGWNCRVEFYLYRSDESKEKGFKIDIDICGNCHRKIQEVGVSNITKKDYLKSIAIMIQNSES